MQRAIFPIKKTWESQHMNEGSHKDTKALDFGILNPYNETKLYAPFDGKIVYVDSLSLGGGIAFESLQKVKYADGTEDYMTLWTGHDNKPPKLGATYKQGEYYSDMGTAGGVATHCHLEVIKGKFKMTNKVTSQRAYKFDNTIEPFKALYLNEDTLIKYSKYKWTTLPKYEVTDVVERDENANQIKVIVSNLRVRTGHSTNDEIIGFAQNGGIYNDLEVYKDNSYTWHRIAEKEWVADNGEWLEILASTDYEKLYNEQLEKNKKMQETINDLQLKMKEINKLSA